MGALPHAEPRLCFGLLCTILMGFGYLATLVYLYLQDTHTHSGVGRQEEEEEKGEGEESGRGMRVTVLNNPQTKMRCCSPFYFLLPPLLQLVRLSGCVCGRGRRWAGVGREMEVGSIH